jgi:hypothetical protein
MQAARSTFPKDFQYAITVGELVMAVFQYVGPKDRVVCRYCGGQFYDWHPADNAMEKHEKKCPACPLLLYNERAQAAPTDYTHLTVWSPNSGDVVEQALQIVVGAQQQALRQLQQQERQEQPLPYM